MARGAVDVCDVLLQLLTELSQNARAPITALASEQRAVGMALVSPGCSEIANRLNSLNSRSFTGKKDPPFTQTQEDTTPLKDPRVLHVL